ncbi:UMP kinase [Candidatus Woesearchaeota archaeon]|nr:UMP kinase [Candidatus Woesearchaeota archaeon]
MKVVIVFSLGGSLIVPDKVDHDYLTKFKNFIEKLNKKYKIIIVTGGGKTAREYMKEVKGDKVKSLIGIMTTKLNARLISGLFNITIDIPDTLEEVKKQIEENNLVVTGALGVQPHMTSDGNAAEIAEYLKAKIFINLTNVNGLYDKDPRKYKNSKLISYVDYKSFNDIIKKIKYEAGQHFILDQAAAEIITRSKTETAILNGKDFNNLQRFFDKKEFIGTIIS